MITTYLIIWAICMSIIIWLLIRKVPKQCEHKNTFTYTDEKYKKVYCWNCWEKLSKTKIK